MKRQSEKVKANAGEFQAVYKIVRVRSGGRCECNLFHDPTPPFSGLRCNRQAVDPHHLYKPRRSHHDENYIVHLCRSHHDRCEWPYKRGRLVISPLGGGAFHFAIRYAADKFAARESLMKTIIALFLMLAVAASAAHAAYPAHDPCVKTQRVDTIRGTYSTDPLRCPPSSFTQYMAWAHRRPEWIEAPGSGGNGVGGGAASAPGGMGHGGGTAAGTR